MYRTKPFPNPRAVPDHSYRPDMQPAMGILVAYGPPPPQPAAAPTFQNAAPLAVIIRHEFMHTSTWKVSRSLKLGTWHDKPVVQFMQGPWHGAWKLLDGELHIWWHWTGDEAKLGAHPMIYSIIEKTDSYRRGWDSWVETLTPVRYR